MILLLRRDQLVRQLDLFRVDGIDDKFENNHQDRPALRFDSGFHALRKR